MKKTTKKSKKASKNWGFNTRDMDRGVRPQDDFFHYANGGWTKRTAIPPTESRWGRFTKLCHDTDLQLRKILEEITRTKKLSPGSPKQLVRDLYLSAINTKLRQKLGAQPLNHLYALIDSIHDRKSLLTCLARLEKRGISLPWHLVIDQDAKDSSRYVLHFYQGGLGMPDREYYLKNDAEFVRVRTAYKKYMGKILLLSGKKKSAITGMVDTIMNIENHLAKISMDKVEARDAEKIYHKKKLAELSSLAPSVDWKQYLKDAHIPSITYVIICQPKFLSGLSVLLKTIPIEDWKIYLLFHVTASAAPLLSPSFVKTNFDFYGKTMTGSKKMKPEWRRALGAVNGGLGEALGKIYVEKHFSPEAKRKMNVLVDGLFGAYGKRIKTLDWMSPATKKKALIKLNLMQRKIGYPKRFKTYRGLSITPLEYFENMIRINMLEHKKAVRKLKKKIDKNEWHMSPQTVNAYCNFNLNEIVFPAAILQPPFFDFSADDGLNYGAIGSVIGHEITHGFDDQGSKFDGHGNMKSWWTKDDKRLFEKKAKLLAKQYDGYKVADGIRVNGKLTLGENIADLGGLSIALDAYRFRLNKTGRKNIDGFTPEERFFLGAAHAECEIYRDEYAKMQVINDPHSPAEFRVNGPVQNIDEFYKTYAVKKGDKLYREEKNRVRIW